MTDTLSKEQRSHCMAQVKSEWTSCEIKIHNWLKGNKIKHKMHPSIEGSPDIVFPRKKLAVFIHGCFWHKCPKCYREPSSNKEYWLKKIKSNVIRDKKNILKLKKHGYRVIVLWEHEIKKDPESCLWKIKIKLSD